MADQPLIISIGSLVGAVMGLIKAEWDSSAVVKKIDELERRLDAKIRELSDTLEKRIAKLETARAEPPRSDAQPTRRGNADLRDLAARVEEIEEQVAQWTARPVQRSGSFPGVDLGSLQSRVQALESHIADLLRRIGELERFERSYHEDYARIIAKVHEVLGRLGRRRHGGERDSEG
jgi:tetrahydromethanopterin S-methyltransferase subunit G